MKRKRYLLFTLLFIYATTTAYGKSLHISNFELYITPIDSARTTINVSFNNSKAGDTLTLLYYEDLLMPYPTDGLDKAIKINTAVKNDGEATFKFSASKKFGYLSIVKQNKDDLSSLQNGISPRSQDLNIFTTDVLLPPMLVESGDFLDIGIKQNDLKKLVSTFGNLSYQFLGPSSQKYTLMVSIDSVMGVTSELSPAFDKTLVFNRNNTFDSKISRALHLLEQNKETIDDDFYYRLKANIIYGKSKKNRDYNIKSFYENWVSTQDSKTISKFRTIYNDLQDGHNMILPEEALLDSKEYTEYLMLKEYYYSTINYGKIDADKIYNAIKTKYHGQVRDKLIVAYFFSLTVDSSITDLNVLLDNAMETVTTPYYNEQLLQYKMSSKGASAYDFSLPDTTGKEVRLSDFKGKIVFVDFWYTGCASCIKYYQEELSKVEHHFKDNQDIVFITISIDKSFDFWKKSVIGGQYTSPDIVNLYTDGLGSAHPVISRYNVRSYPRPIIIDRDGHVYLYNDSSLGKSATLIQVLNKIKSL